MGVDVRVDPDRYIGLEAMHMSHLVYYIYLLERLAVERLDSKLESVIYLLVALSDSGVYDLVGREAAGVSVEHFVSADTVSSEAF